MTVSISGAIDFLQDKYVLSPALQGPVISSSIIGGVIGAGFSGFLSDKYGRRRSTGRRAKSSTRPRLLRLLANLIIWVVCVQTTLLRSVGF